MVAADIGDTIVNPDGVVCDCGRYGCLETVASLSALKKQARVSANDNRLILSLILKNLQPRS